MTTNFGFARAADSRLLANGTIRIYGALLDELKALRNGDILELKDKVGRGYVVLTAEDFARLQSGKKGE